MMNIYREEILDHYNHPRNFGDLPGATHTAREANASCGDLLEVAMVIREQTAKNASTLVVADVRFKGIGCALSIATASMLTEKVKGKPVRAILKMKEEELIQLLKIDVTATRMKCVTLPLRAFQRALAEFSSQFYEQ